MPDFGYTEQDIRLGADIINQQATTSSEIAGRLRTALAQIENGDWVGQGATAFTEEMRLLIGQTDSETASLNRLSANLTKVLANLEELGNSMMATITS